MPPRYGGTGRKRPAYDFQDDEYDDIPVAPGELVEEGVADEWRMPSAAPSKRARTSWTPPRRPRAGRPPPPARGGDSNSVRFANLPAEYTYDMVMEMHSSFGLDVATVEDLDFEPFERLGRGGPTVRALLVRYSDRESANAAREALANQPVLNRNGDTLVLGAQLVGGGGRQRGPSSYGLAVRPRSPEAIVQRWEPSPPRGRRKGGGKGGGKKGSKGPEVIYPSAYISDVPVEFKEGTIMKLHDACSLDTSKVMAVKFLPAQDKSAETCCCIVRYLDQEAADKAVAAIKGRPVQLRSGACKFFGAKIAKPARWMVELGLATAPEEPKPVADGADGKEPNEADWCGQGASCLGTVGMLLYEDVSTGTPFCEACWERFEREDAGAIEDTGEHANMAELEEGQ